MEDLKHLTSRNVSAIPKMEPRARVDLSSKDFFRQYTAVRLE
jgi:hypothetical protein